MGDASHAFVHLHAMLVTEKWISASPNSTFVPYGIWEDEGKYF